MEHTGLIDGRLVRGEGERFAVENPSDESLVAELAGLSLPQIAQAIASARRAFDEGPWRGLPRQQRAEATRRFVAALHSRADRLTELAVAEAGCPIASGTMAAQVKMPLRHADEAIELFLMLPEVEENPVPLADRVAMGGQGMVQSLRRYDPLGVVSAIAAYNVPVFTALWKVVPGLLAGNSVVLRPNPLTPLSAMVFAEAAIAAELPPGVLNVVIEAGLEGARLMTTDAAIDMVSFTGSCAVGAKVAEQAAPTLKRLVLELGGKSAQIFLPDSVEKAAMQCLVVAVAHGGQGCALGTRIFVPEERKAEVLDAAAKLLAGLRIGPASDPATQAGPVINAAAVARCERFVAEAVAHGGRVVCGGKRPAHLASGHYFEPTVLDLPDNSNPAAQEEIFGPVSAVIGYRDLDHAVAMANDSKFGLSGYVHGLDRAAALKVGLAIRSGTVNVNAGMASAWASSGGIRMSGLGRERGIEGLRAFQQMSVLNLG
ncbi:MAG: aldehyde dehydrogenase family protein [Sphingomonadales bacterium]|nr:aldehyde dehydrogenase family protein [Sphingomonadales bacterium]